MKDERCDQCGGELIRSPWAVGTIVEHRCSECGKITGRIEKSASGAVLEKPDPQMKGRRPPVASQRQDACTVSTHGRSAN